MQRLRHRWDLVCVGIGSLLHRESEPVLLGGIPSALLGGGLDHEVELACHRGPKERPHIIASRGAGNQIRCDGGLI